MVEWLNENGARARSARPLAARAWCAKLAWGIKHLPYRADARDGLLGGTQPQPHHTVVAVHTSGHVYQQHAILLEACSTLLGGEGARAVGWRRAGVQRWWEALYRALSRRGGHTGTAGNQFWAPQTARSARRLFKVSLPWAPLTPHASSTTWDLILRQLHDPPDADETGRQKPPYQKSPLIAPTGIGHIILDAK